MKSRVPPLKRIFQFRHPRYRMEFLGKTDAGHLRFRLRKRWTVIPVETYSMMPPRPTRRVTGVRIVQGGLPSLGKRR
jgi:hypothetical protein